MKEEIDERLDILMETIEPGKPMLLSAIAKFCGCSENSLRKNFNDGMAKLRRNQLLHQLHDEL